MSFYLPTDVVNIIFQYYSQLNDTKWSPFIDIKTGDLKRTVNKYSAKYDNINKILQHKQKSPINNISVDIDVTQNGEIINSYNTTGTSVFVATRYIVTYYQLIIPILYFYIEFKDEHGFNCTVFCPKNTAYCEKFKFDVYQDGAIHSKLIDIHTFSKTTYSVALEKY